ncbi:hypothetical protein ACFXPS_21975 [Nocardia sp. NPDC059091]
MSSSSPGTVSAGLALLERLAGAAHTQTDAAVRAVAAHGGI